MRFSDDHFSQNYKQTVGVDFFIRRLNIPRKFLLNFFCVLCLTEQYYIVGLAVDCHSRVTKLFKKPHIATCVPDKLNLLVTPDAAINMVYAAPTYDLPALLYFVWYAITIDLSFCFHPAVNSQLRSCSTDLGYRGSVHWKQNGHKLH